MKINKDFLKSYIKENNCTLAGVGPMSKNCIDVAVNLSNKNNFPLFMICSRRQIESKQYGGGYVENFDTETFAKYVKKQDKKKTIILSRDHGGPWQNQYDLENKVFKKDAFNSAIESFKTDIRSGFKVLHIDTSVSPYKNIKKKEINEMLFELYAICMDYAKSKNKNIMIEVGTEEQNEYSTSINDIEENLKLINNFCNKFKFEKPLFFVAQTGTKVMENKNIGSFDSAIRINNELPSEILLPLLIKLCDKYDIMLKEHNADYISAHGLKWHPRLRIHAANIAPEFGVTEFSTLINILEQNKLNDLAKNFINISYNSKKWKKWVIDEKKITKREKAILSGHYTFALKEFKSLKKEASLKLQNKGINLNRELKVSIENVMLKYFQNFRLIRQ